MVSELQNWEKTEQSSWCERNSGKDWKADTADENRETEAPGSEHWQAEAAIFSGQKRFHF